MCYDEGGFADIIFLQKLFYLFSASDSIHAWHIDIHENQFIGLQMMIWEGPFSNFRESLIAWVSEVAVNVKLRLKHHLENFDVKNCVINYQYIV